MNTRGLYLTDTELRTVIEQASRAGAEAALRSVLSRLDPMRPRHVNVKQAMEMTGIGRTKLNQLIDAHKIKVNDVGTIPIDQIDRLINEPADFY
jgi:RNA-binding protein YlmH